MFRVPNWVFDIISKWFCMVLRRGIQKTIIFKFWVLSLSFLVSKPCFLSFSTQNHAESYENYLKNLVLDPIHAKLNKNSDFGHVRTYFWLHKLRKHKGIYEKSLGNKYGIYKEYRGAGEGVGGGARTPHPPPAPLYSIYIYIYIFPKFVHVFPVCFLLIYGVKSRSGHDRIQSFGPIWHVSGSEMVFRRNL